MMTEAVAQNADLTVVMKTKLKNSGKKVKTSVSVTPAELVVTPGQQVDLKVTWTGCSNSITATLKFVNSQDPISDNPDDSSEVTVTSSSPSTPGKKSTFTGTGAFTINAKATTDVDDDYILTLTIDGIDYSVDPRIKVKDIPA